MGAVIVNGQVSSIPSEIGGYRPGDITAPISGAFVITPSNTVDLPRVTRQVFFTGAGDVAVVWLDGSETVETVAAGARMDWQLRKIKATGTTATGIRGYC